jgi:hypothetical protein
MLKRVRYEPTDIVSVWQCVHPETRLPLPAQHLTTFSPPESSYKALEIPLPEPAKVGEKWRLGVFQEVPSLDYKTPSILELTSHTPGVVGVWSEGIDIVSGVRSSGPLRGIGGEASKEKQKAQSAPGGNDKKGKGKAKVEDIPKQGRVCREWSLPDGRHMVMVEQTSFDLDKVCYSSTVCDIGLC